MQTSVLPPGPKGRFLVGALPEIRRDELDYLDRLVREYGDVVFLRVVHHRVYILSHPRDVEFVLLNNSSNFVKSVFLRESRALFGNGLLTSDGRPWLRQRRLLQHTFHHSRIAGYSRIMIDSTERMMATWRDGEVCDIHDHMTRLTLDIIAKVLFGEEMVSDVKEACGAFRTFFGQFDERFGLYFIPEWFPTRENIRYGRAIRGLDRIVKNVIRQKRAHGHDSGDILSALLATGSDGAMSDRQLRDEIMTLFFTGHETTALALTWTWYLLGQHPEIEERVREEANQVLGDRPPSMEDIPKLRFVDMVVKESLRLYPPAYGVVREAIQDCEIAGYHIPAGATLAMFQWVVHRDPRHFDRPNEFIPDRWTSEFLKNLPNGAYFPFGLGPRVCIGNSFATAELILLVAAIARRFRFELVPTHPVRTSVSLTLRPLRGIRVTVRQRP